MDLFRLTAIETLQIDNHTHWTTVFLKYYTRKQLEYILYICNMLKRVGKRVQKLEVTIFGAVIPRTAR